MDAAPRTLMVSTSYPADLSDWRGLFIRNLVYALARRSDLDLQLWAPPGEVPANVEPIASAKERAWLGQLMMAGGIAHLIRMRNLRSLTSPLHLLWMLRNVYRRSTADIYHVNWLQNALALPDDGRPLLISVLGTDLQLLKLPLMRSWLRIVFRHRGVVICPNAEWMVPILTREFGDLAKVRFVPFGIDSSWFQVKRTLPETGPRVWLCVTRLTEGKLGHLPEWGAAAFGGGDRELHLFGPMQQKMTLPAWMHYHGPATPEALCKEWFPRAHGLITLSQHAEGRPQVMLEAMAAGLPIVASRLPAHVDMIEHGRNGLLCDDSSEVELALDTLDDIDANIRMGRQGLKWVTDAIGTWDDCAARYAALYHELMDRPQP